MSESLKQVRVKNEAKKHGKITASEMQREDRREWLQAVAISLAVIAAGAQKLTWTGIARN